MTITDKAASGRPGTPDMTVGTDTGSSDSDNITSDTTPTFTVSCVNGETVTLFEDGSGDAPSTRVCAGGSVTLTVTGGLIADGNHTITAIQNDLAGNQSVQSSGLTVIIDTSNPVIIPFLINHTTVI